MFSVTKQFEMGFMSWWRRDGTEAVPSLAHRAERWIPFFAPNDVPLEGLIVGSIPKVHSALGPMLWRHGSVRQR
jgi:hypothetical protein